MAAGFAVAVTAPADAPFQLTGALMHPLPGPSASTWTRPTLDDAPTASLSRRPLTPAECQEVLRQVQATCRAAYSFIAFLQSDDPAADMPPARRQDLKSRCLEAANTHHLEDLWPQVGTGLPPYPSHRPLPAFTAHHQDQMLQRMALLTGVAKECNAMAQARLETFLAPVRNELIEVETLLSPLPGTYRLPARDEAIRLVRRLDEWRTAHCGEACRIARSVAMLTTPRQPVSLKDTREALQALLALRRGDDGSLTPLSAQQQPAFEARWQRLLTLLEQDALPAFRRELGAMQQWRRRLLDGCLDVFYTPMPMDDPDPTTPSPTWTPE